MLKKKKEEINFISFKTKTMRFVSCLKKPIKMQIEKKTIPQKTFLNANYVFWDVAQIAKIESEINLKCSHFWNTKKREKMI